jgi:hypothetical protein
VIIDKITAHASGSPAELRFEFSARSNLCDRVTIVGKVSPETLASKLEIEIRRLNLRESYVLLPLQATGYALQGEVSLEAKLDFVGLQDFKASIDGSAGSLVIAHGGRSATMVAKSLKTIAAYKSGNLQIDVERLDLGAPRLQASGELRSHEGLLSARMKIRGLDIAETGDVVLRIAGNTESVKKGLQYLPAGTIPEVSIHTTGRSFAEMASIKHLSLAGLLRDGKIIIPGPNLELQNVNGAVRLSGGILEADGVSAKSGEAKAWNGKLRLGLEGAAAPFHFDALFNAGAGALHALLLRHLQDGPFQGEIMKLRNVDGELTGRVILGESLDAVSPIVEVSKANISATYDRLPVPFAVRSGRFSYDRGLVRVDKLQGSVGRSTFREVHMTLQKDESRQVSIAATGASLDLSQIFTVLHSFKNSRSPLQELQSARGQIELDSLTMSGAYDDPGGWIFAGAGTFDRVEIQHANFADRIALARGKFAATQGRIAFSDTVAAMSDASFTGGGSFEYDRTGPLRFETNGVGTSGVQMTRRLGEYFSFPDDLQLRAPLNVAAEHLAWRAGGDISFRGQIKVAGEPLLALDAVKQPSSLAVRELSLVDGGRRARMGLELTKNNLNLSFSGEVAHETIEKVFATFPMKGSSLRGDIVLSAALTEPVTVSAQGRLDGTNFVIPAGAKKRAVVEKFSLETSGQAVQVRSAELLWGKSRLALSGAVTGTGDLLRVDMDVAGDQLDWEELQNSFGAASKQGLKESGRMISVPNVEGIVRLKTERFMIDRFNVSPLEATVAISPSGIRTQLARGVVCGIDAKGRVDFIEQDIVLDLALSAMDGQLEPTTICLTNQQSDVKGTYSFTARVEGRGDRDRLRSVLRGSFELNARDGEFVRAAGLDAAFDYLNDTGDFAVNFPDLNKQSFPYRLLAAKGRLDGERIFADEVIIQASPLTVASQGSVDLQGKQIDFKALVSVALPTYQVIKRIPIIGAIVGGSLVGIPVRINGPLARPEVTYLSPADVGMELLSVPMRILGAPLEAIKLFAPSGNGRD